MEQAEQSDVCLLGMANHETTKISESTWRIDEFGMVNAFLCIGEERNALIDTGCGIGNIKKAAMSISDKPLSVFLTHSHPDHAGGIYQFKDCPVYMNSLDEGLKLWGMRTDNAFRKMYAETRGANSFKGDISELYRLIPESNPDCTSFRYEKIDDGALLSLGKRKFKCIHTPGHTDGSMCFLDERNRLLFSGDTVNNSIILMRQPGNDARLIRIFYETLLKIKEHENEFDYLVIGHGYPLLEKDIIDDYLFITSGLLHGRLMGEYEERGFRKGDVARKGKAELWYQCDS